MCKWGSVYSLFTINDQKQWLFLSTEYAGTVSWTSGVCTWTLFLWSTHFPPVADRGEMHCRIPSYPQVHTSHVWCSLLDKVDWVLGSIGQSRHTAGKPGAYLADCGLRIGAVLGWRSVMFHKRFFGHLNAFIIWFDVWVLLFLAEWRGSFIHGRNVWT